MEMSSVLRPISVNKGEKEILPKIRRTSMSSEGIKQHYAFSELPAVPNSKAQ